jgi:uncharacterized protein involved in exopolysaccharide biosynthesis
MNLTIYRLGALALKNRWLLLGLPLVTAMVALSAYFIRPPRYLAEARFAPQRTEAGGASQFAGLAAQFGLNLGAAGPGEPLEFYAELLRSRMLLEGAVAMPVASGAAARVRTVADVLAPGEPASRQRAAAVRGLAGRIQVLPDARSNLVTVRLTMADAALAESVLQRLIELVQEFNIEKRQTSAAAERRFVEGRLQAAERELRAAEAELERFMSRNRRWRESSLLSLQATQLQARVSLRQDVYTSLAQSFEKARIDEVRNTPVITVIDQPIGSARRTGGSLPLVLVLSLGLGLLFAAAWIATTEYLGQQRQRDPAGYAALRALYRHDPGTQRTSPPRGNRAVAAGAVGADVGSAPVR